MAAVAIALEAQGDAKGLVEALGARVGQPAWHEVGLLTVGYVGLIQQLDRVAGEVVEALVIRVLEWVCRKTVCPICAGRGFPARPRCAKAAGFQVSRG